MSNETKFTVGLSYWRVVELVAALPPDDRKKFFERVETKVKDVQRTR